MPARKKNPSNEYTHPFEAHLAALLREEGYHFRYQPEGSVFELDTRASNGQFRTILFYEHDSGTLHVRSFIPMEVRDHRKLQLAELVARINQRLLLGHMAFDMEEGSLYMNTVHQLQSCALDQECFHALLLSNICLANDAIVPLLNVNVGHDEPVLAAMMMGA